MFAYVCTDLSSFPQTSLMTLSLYFKHQFAVFLIRSVDRSTASPPTRVIIYSFRIKQSLKIWNPLKSACLTAATFRYPFCRSAHGKNPPERRQGRVRERGRIWVSTRRRGAAEKGEHKERIHEGGRKKQRGGGEEMKRIMMKTMRGADADKRRDDGADDDETKGPVGAKKKKMKEEKFTSSSRRNVALVPPSW